jgi:antitoxin CptB
MKDQARKAKIRWHCRRGMLELDLILNQFLQKSLDNLAEKQLDALEKLLTVTDPELYSWLMEETNPEEQELKKIVKLIQMQHSI